MAERSGHDVPGYPALRRERRVGSAHPVGRDHRASRQLADALDALARPVTPVLPEEQLASVAAGGQLHEERHRQTGNLQPSHPGVRLRDRDPIAL